MHLATLPLEQAIGHILRHNLADAAGHKAFAKGHHISAADLLALRALGVHELRVAVLEPGDVHEDEAAHRLALAVAGPGLRASRAVHSRVNLLAETHGLVQVNIDALRQINQIDGLTIATLAHNSLAQPRKRVATIKIIPFAVPAADLERAEALGRRYDPLVGLRPLQPLAIGVILVGSQAARTRIEHGVYPAIAGRVHELGAQVLALQYVPPDEQAVATAILALHSAGAKLLIIAGETSIMDKDDITPSGIRLAGGRVEHYGAPVEPGNLLLLGYLKHPAGGELAVLGAPGCVRSRDVNIVDLLLPRLLAGEHLTRDDIIALGHGGLLS